MGTSLPGKHIRIYIFAECFHAAGSGFQNCLFLNSSAVDLAACRNRICGVNDVVRKGMLAKLQGLDKGQQGFTAAAGDLHASNGVLPVPDGNEAEISVLPLRGQEAASVL